MSIEAPVGHAHLCLKGHEFTAVRRESSRVAPLCPVCDANGTMSSGQPIGPPPNETYGRPNISIPKKFHTSWSDVHDVSERELAKDPKVERYNPSGVRTGKTNQGGMTAYD